MPIVCNIHSKNATTTTATATIATSYIETLRARTYVVNCCGYLFPSYGDHFTRMYCTICTQYIYRVFYCEFESGNYNENEYVRQQQRRIYVKRASSKGSREWIRSIKTAETTIVNVQSKIRSNNSTLHTRARRREREKNAHTVWSHMVHIAFVAYRILCTRSTHAVVIKIQRKAFWLRKTLNANNVIITNTIQEISWKTIVWGTQKNVAEWANTSSSRREKHIMQNRSSKLQH